MNFQLKRTVNMADITMPMAAQISGYNLKSTTFISDVTLRLWNNIETVFITSSRVSGHAIAQIFLFLKGQGSCRWVFEIQNVNRCFCRCAGISKRWWAKKEVKATSQQTGFVLFFDKDKTIDIASRFICYSESQIKKKTNHRIQNGD